MRDVTVVLWWVGTCDVTLSSGLLFLGEFPSNFMYDVLFDRRYESRSKYPSESSRDRTTLVNETGRTLRIIKRPKKSFTGVQK